jgi:filamentous hemagglutinin family protein
VQSGEADVTIQEKREYAIRRSLVSLAVAGCFAAGAASANPVGPNIVSGSVSLQQPNASTLNVTNSPGAIIHWQGFSIGAGEVTRFIQESSASSVLNRVVGGDLSQIHGQLLSNGRVFLINPGGILIGPGAVVDTAGFVASTLNMVDADFLQGKLRFSGDGSSGTIVNQGWIRTGYGGQVVLVAPQIENSGLVHTPGGELILAAGRKLVVSSLDHEGVQFEVQAPADSVVNVGQLLADGGAVGVFAGTLRHSGDIRANSLVYDQAGRIVLKAAGEIDLAPGSGVTADGKSGGSVTVQATAGLNRVAGAVSARGSDGTGGDIRILGERVALLDGAAVNAAGTAGGGQILVGGDFQGRNAEVQNSSATYVAAGATLGADATIAGDGGRIIVWSDDKAQFYGSLSARGGPAGGNGGFAEVSGRQNLIFAGTADLGAPQGALGTLLLDPLDLYVDAAGGQMPQIINNLDPTTEFPSNAVTVSPATLASIVGNVSLYASRYLRINDPIILTTPGQGLTATVGTYTLPSSPDPLALSSGTIFNELEIGAGITTAGGAVSLAAPSIQAVAASTIATAGGAITIDAPGSVSASLLSLDAGSGAVTATSTGSFMQFGALTGGSVAGNALSSISTGAIATGGGAVSLTTTGSSISTGAITAGGGAVTLSGANGVFTGTINTTGNVGLNAVNGSIFTNVDNAASLTATAASSVNISSTTDVNIADVTAGTFGTATVTTSGGSIRGTSDASKVTGFDVTLQTGQLTNGGIVGAAQPLNVDVQRTFNFSPNGTFNVLLTGSGPNRLNSNVGVAASGSYSGMLTKSGGGLTMDVSATTSTVTLNSLSITSGFDQRVLGSNPDIAFRVPNGALVATSVSVPTGDTVSTFSEPNGIPLNVSLRSSGDLTLASYTRAAGGLAKLTSIQSDSGSVSLGAVNASKDTVTVSGPTGITVDSLISTGNVTLTSSSGAVNAAGDDTSVDVSSGGALSISARGIGTSAFGNPLDLAASTISLSASGGSLGPIGGANPVIAETQSLTVNAAGGSTFNVSTGTTSLANLVVSANATAVGDAGVARVVTAGGTATYDFDSNAGNFIFNPPASSGRNLTFTATAGSIALGATDLGTGSLHLTASGAGASITSDGANIAAADVALFATSSIDTTGAGPGNIIASAGSISLHGRDGVTTGALNATDQLAIDGCFIFCGSAAVSVGTVGAVTAPASVSISGTTVTSGAVTGAGDITLSANSGMLTVGGAIATSDGSTVDLRSTGGSPFLFGSIDAGVTGSVIINSASGIRQQYLGTGIKAQTIELLAGNGDIHALDSMGGATHLDLLNGTNSLNLTVDVGGTVLIDANGNALASLTATKRSGPDADPFTISGLGGGQVVSIGGGASDLEVAVSSPTLLDLDLTFTPSAAVVLTGGGISTSGGHVFLSSGGDINATAGGITTGGGDVTLTASGAGGVTAGTITTTGGKVDISAFGGGITTGTISSSGGPVDLFAADAIVVGGNLAAGAGAVNLEAGTSITRTGGSQISSSTSVDVYAGFGDIGTSATPLLITSPVVRLDAVGTSGTPGVGHAFATLTGTADLEVIGANGFNVSSDTAFTSIAVETNGTGSGTPGGGTLNLTAPGQTYVFDRPSTDLFGASVAGSAVEVVSVNAPGAVARFTALDGILLVRGAGGGPNKINVQDLTLQAFGGGDVSLQGNAANPLVLSHAIQEFSADGGATADVLIRGTVTLSATTSQDFFAIGNITVNADAGGGGMVTIGAPTQNFTTGSSGSKIELLGGAASGEKVAVAATTQQRIVSTSSSVDSLKLLGGAGQDASVVLSHSGSGVQDFQMQSGTITVAGGSGQNAFAKIEETGTNQQKICFQTTFSCNPIGTLQVLGGTGAGAYAQIAGAGSQFVRVSGATLVKGGTGDGAHALIQAGTGASQSLQLGALTVEGQGAAGAVARAEILSTGSQSIQAGNILVKAGSNAGSIARIAATGSQFVSGASLTLTAGGAGQTTEPFVAVPGASAIVEGQDQFISLGGALALNGGAGISGNTSDALLRNLSGSQSIFANTVTLSGGHTQSMTAIINLGTGTQSISASSGILVRSDPNLPPAHADAFVLIENQAATAQTINASSGGLTLLNSGDGSVAVTSAGTQSITTRFVDVSTAAGSAGDASLFATGDQRIHTTGQSTGGYGVLVAARGTGTAKIESGASQLLEVGYPEVMTTGSTTGVLKVGDADTAGISRVKAVDQNVFAGSVIVESGSGNGAIAELKAVNDQWISTLGGGLQVIGGSGSNTVAQIDPVTQTIVVNGSIDIFGGSGTNSVAQILNGTGAQTLLATNGDVFLEGGTGPSSDSQIVSGGTQTIGTSGTIELLPVSGGGNASISPLGSVSCASPCIVSSVAPASSSGEIIAETTVTSQITTDETLIDIVSDLFVAEADTTELRRRVPICR